MNLKGEGQWRKIRTGDTFLHFEIRIVTIADLPATPNPMDLEALGNEK